MNITKELVIPNYGLEGTQGKDGLPAIYTTVTNQNIVLNAPYQGLPSDYSKANGNIQVFEGDNEVTEQATYTLKQTLNVVAELDFNKFKVTQVSTDNGMFIVTVTYKEFVSDIMITTNIVRNGQQGQPTGIIESPTIPTEVYQGMLWKNTGHLSGFITDVTYIYRGSKWEKYIFSADNIYADNLAAITANLGDVTGGSFTGSKFVNNYDLRYIGDTWQRGSLRIDDGVLKDESEFYNKVTGEVTNTNMFYTLHNSLEQISTNIKTGHRQVGIFSSSGITLTDSQYKTYGPSTMVYQDFIKVPPIQLTPSNSNWRVYATSGGNRPTVSRNGRLVQIKGAFTNNVPIGGSDQWVEMLVLPEWARPVEAVNYLAQATSTYIYNIDIQPNGSVRMARYRNSQNFTNAGAGSWFNLSTTFSAADFT